MDVSWLHVENGVEIGCKLVACGDGVEIGCNLVTCGDGMEIGCKLVTYGDGMDCIFMSETI